MSDSLSRSSASVESVTATNPNTQYPDELDFNISRSDDKKSVSAPANALNLSPNSSAQEYYDLDVGDLEQDDNGVSNKTETVNAPLSSNLSIQEGYDLDVNNWRSDDRSVSDESGGASEQRYYDFQPTWTTNVNVTKIPADACWHSELKMSRMNLDIHWDKQKALFKLYTRISLNQAAGEPVTNRKAYILIYPERIQKLVFKAKPTYGNFHSPISLTFSLNRPSALILPEPQFGFTQQAEGVISSLRSLVQQLSFTIDTDLPRSKLSPRLLGEICTMITHHKLSSIASLSNWRNLYQGSGEKAVMIEGESLLESVIHEEDAASLRPPAYEERDPSVPLSCSTKRKARELDVPLAQSTKRRKSEDSSTIGQSLQDDAANQTLFGDGSGAKFVADDKRKPEEMLSAFLCTLDEKESTFKQEIKREVEEMLLTHKQEVQRQLYDLKDTLTDTLTETIEEKISEEMGEVQDLILDKVSSAYITIPGFS